MCERSRCKKCIKYGDVFVLIPEDLEFLNYFEFSDIKIDTDGAEYFTERDWKRFYDGKMLVVKEWIKDNHDELLDRVNEHAIKVMTDKYASGNIARQEMEALSYYHSYHELDTPEYSNWLKSLGVSDFEHLPEEPEIDYIKNGRKYFKLYRIAGTSIGRDKQKNIVGLDIALETNLL